jgi:Icc-related predicted phosphoesterase
MRILFLTDLHGRRVAKDELGRLTENCDLLLVGGDMTNFGDTAAAARVLEPWRSLSLPFFAVAGNVDQPEVAAWLEKENLSLQGAGVVVDQVGIVGSGGSNPTPLNTPLEYSEEELSQQLRQGWDRIEKAPRRIVMSHTPPQGTAVDRIASGLHVGSTAVRSFLEERQPDLCLCGHIHEAAGVDMLGKTAIVNPGTFASGRYATVEISLERVSWEIHSD